MNAQEIWKSAYHNWKKSIVKINTKDDISMRRYVREAALERQIAAQQRRIAELNRQLDDALTEINSRDEREALRDKLEWG